ncbi:MAG: LuxR family transcriptional regulator [Hyphomicrobiales bacterium]
MEANELHTYLLQSVRRLKSCSSLHELRGSFVGVIFQLGFQQFSYARFIGKDIVPSHSVYTYAEEWISIYLKNSYQDIDPVLLEGSRTSEPFYWSSERYEDDQALTEFFDTASEYGVSWGVTTPLKASLKANAVLTCSASKTSRPPDGISETQLVTCSRVLSEAFHQCALSVADDASIALKPREMEVLELSALGMSGNEIASITGISPIYVAEVSRNIIQKFGVRNKLAALWRARELGLLGGGKHP